MILVSEIEFKKFIKEHNWISKQTNKAEFSHSKTVATVIEWFTNDSPRTKIATHVNYTDKNPETNINLYYIWR